MPQSPPPSAEALLAHAGFLRAVAWATLRREDLVDDVVQDTYVTAMEREATRRGPLRAWLGGIARRKALAAQRCAASARSHEARAARPEAVEDAAARTQAMRRVIDAVLALPEDYQAVVVLRYYDDLPPRKIARALGVPVETVRTRLRRALERLRVGFEADARRSGRDERLLLLPPAGGPPTPSPVPTSGVGGWLMGSSVPLVAGGLVVLLAVGLLVLRPWGQDERGEAPRTEQAAGAREPSAEPPATPVARDRAAEDRGAERPPHVAAAPRGVPPELEVRVTDDTDGDGRWVEYEWSGWALTTRTQSEAEGDAYAEASIEADLGEGFQFLGGGASAVYGDEFNPTNCTVCLDRWNLDSGQTIRIVTTYLDRDGDVTDTEVAEVQMP